MKQVMCENMDEFAKVKENEWFEYYPCLLKDNKPLFGVKIDENYVAFINCNMMFIIGKVYKNFISIGSKSIEFKSFYELIDALANRIDAITKICKL